MCRDLGLRHAGRAGGTPLLHQPIRGRDRREGGAEERLRRSERQCRDLIEYAPDGVFRGRSGRSLHRRQHCGVPHARLRIRGARREDHLGSDSSRGRAAIEGGKGASDSGRRAGRRVVAAPEGRRAGAPVEYERHNPRRRPLANLRPARDVSERKRAAEAEAPEARKASLSRAEGCARGGASTGTSARTRLGLLRRAMRALRLRLRSRKRPPRDARGADTPGRSREGGARAPRRRV